MATLDLLRQKINSLLAQPAADVADAAINLWERLAAQIISIVGERGFNSLYARTLFLCEPSFPCLADLPLPSQHESRFAPLQMSLARQFPEQITSANTLLFVTFIGILTELIGAPLTATIVHSAWCDDASVTPQLIETGSK
ncbi:MAG: hypothetical protein ACYCZH_04270 [Sulfuriferula sp.]